MGVGRAGLATYDSGRSSSEWMGSAGQASKHTELWRAAGLATDEHVHAALDASLQECEMAMVAANRSGDIKVSALNRCFAWLKNKQAYPTRCMKVGGALKKVDDTH